MLQISGELAWNRDQVVGDCGYRGEYAGARLYLRNRYEQLGIRRDRRRRIGAERGSVGGIVDGKRRGRCAGPSVVDRN